MLYRLAATAGVTILLNSIAGAAPLVTAVGYHNVHLRVSDPAAASQWYIQYLGATKAPAPFSVAFGKTLIAFVRTENREPSAGSVIDHIGISYADLRGKMKDFEAGGARSSHRWRTRLAFSPMARGSMGCED